MIRNRLNWKMIWKRKLKLRYKAGSCRSTRLQEHAFRFCTLLTLTQMKMEFFKGVVETGEAIANKQIQPIYAAPLASQRSPNSKHEDSVHMGVLKQQGFQDPENIQGLYQELTRVPLKDRNNLRNTLHTLPYAPYIIPVYPSMVLAIFFSILPTYSPTYTPLLVSPEALALNHQPWTKPCLLYIAHSQTQNPKNAEEVRKPR